MLGQFRSSSACATEPEQFDDQFEDAMWPISGVGVNSNLSASLDPFSIRVIVELNLRCSHSRPMIEAAIRQAKSPPAWEGLRYL